MVAPFKKQGPDMWSLAALVDLGDPKEKVSERSLGIKIYEKWVGDETSKRRFILQPGRSTKPLQTRS